jgi:hypothetical protein
LKALVGTALFLASLFLLRQILVGSGLLPPMAALVFLIGLVGVPFAGILLIVSALDHQQRETRDELDRLRQEIAALRSERSRD